MTGGVVADGLWSEVPCPLRVVATARQALLVVGALMIQGHQACESVWVISQGVTTSFRSALG